MAFFVSAQPQFDIQAHRGCRGLMPENTIEGFIHSVNLGAHTLEMDVVITGDRKVLVSHDHYMSHEFCLDPEGREISPRDEKKHHIFRMNLDSIRKYDCGTKIHPRFPGQKKFKAVKPLLEEVISAVEEHVRKNALQPVFYNIEIKSTPRGDGVHHPPPDVFASMVYGVVKQKGIQSRCIIQSFDPRILRHLKSIRAEVRISLLVANLRSAGWNISRLGFEPDLYCPYFKLLSPRKVARLHSRGIKVIPWTVNKVDDMERLIGMGVDGIITDYPDLLVNLVSR